MHEILERTLQSFQQLALGSPEWTVKAEGDAISVDFSSTSKPDFRIKARLIHVADPFDDNAGSFLMYIWTNHHHGASGVYYHCDKSRRSAESALRTHFAKNLINVVSKFTSQLGDAETPIIAGFTHCLFWNSKQVLSTRARYDPWT
jgi:hypothetical protein